MKNKICWLLIVYLISNLVIASSPSAKDAAIEQKKDLNQWGLVANHKGSDTQVAAELAILSDPNGYFKEKRVATDLHVRTLKHLMPRIDDYIEDKQVSSINSRLYNVGSKGQPAPAEPNLEFYQQHFPLFCSPLSGYESKLSANCKKGNAIQFQHADLRPPFLGTKFGEVGISIASNWVENFLSPVVYSGLPPYIEKPELLADTKYRDQFIRRLRNQIPVAIASNSVNGMLAERIPTDPKDSNSPSIASSIEDEVSSRHLNNNWHEAIMQTNDNLELQKQQALLLALISYQLQRLDAKIERIELLNAALVNNSSNQQEIMTETLHATTKK